MSQESSEQSPRFLLQPALKGYTAESSVTAVNPVGQFLQPYQPQSAKLRTQHSPQQEVDPNGIPSSLPGAKLDAGKVDVLKGAIRYFPEALKDVARLSEVGARKYSWQGWRAVPDGISRYGSALLRHLLHGDESIDNDTGLLHATAVAWNALARLELILAERDNVVVA